MAHGIQTLHQWRYQLFYLYKVVDDDDFGARVAKRHHRVVVLAAREDATQRPQRRTSYHVTDWATDEHVKRPEQPVANGVCRRVPTNVGTKVS